MPSVGFKAFILSSKKCYAIFVLGSNFQILNSIILLNKWQYGLCQHHLQVDINLSRRQGHERIIGMPFCSKQKMSGDM